MAEGEVVADNKYGQLSKEIVNILKDYEYSYFREDKPIPFGDHLVIYPAKVRDFEAFSNCSSCFTLNKNEDPRGIAMSHLDYLMSKTQIKEEDEGRIWSYKMQKLFEIIFHVKNGLKCKKCGKIITYESPEFINFISKIQELTSDPEKMSSSEAPELICPDCSGKEFIEMMKFIKDPKTNKYSLSVDGQTISKDDFAKLRQIVLYQNFPDYVDDSWVDPAIKKDHDEKMRLEQQKNDVHATIEKKVVCLSISTNYNLNDIWDMPIRKFTMALATVDDLINYKIMKQATMSGFVSLPKGKSIEHWIYKPDKDMYGDSYKSTDEVQNSVSNL